MTNDEYLKELASRGDGSLQAWFDAEHVDSTRSANRAAAVERVRKAKDAGTSIGYAIVGREYYPWEAYETLIDLLTDDGGLTNLEWLFIDSEQFRQAVSAFAFAHSDDCPTSPTQIVDWLMAPYVDAHSKPHSKTEQMLTEQSESLSDANDDLAPESDVTEDAVDANDENATCNNSGENVIHDSREKLEADILEERDSFIHTPWGFRRIRKWLDRQAEITAEESAEAWEDYSDSVQREIAELQADNAELRKRFSEIAELNGSAWQDGFEKGCESRDDAIAGWRAETDRLRDELAKRDKGIERLKRQRDTARAKIDELHAECDTCCYKTDYIEMDFCDVDRLEAERDALADDLLTCNRERERLRQALGCAIDRAHEVVSLVNLDGEVIG